MLCPPDDAEDSTGGSAAPFLLECGRQAGGVKHRDGPAISGEFKPGGSEAQKLTAIAFAPKTGIYSSLVNIAGSTLSRPNRPFFVAVSIALGEPRLTKITSS